MKRLILAALFASFGAAAHAAVVYDNGTAINNATSGYFSSEIQDWRVYDDFTLSGTQTIDHVFFQMGLTSGPFNGEFSFSVFNYLGGNNVGSMISTTTLHQGQYTANLNGLVSWPNGPFYDVTFNVAPLTLGPGSYLVSFYGHDMDFRLPNVGSGNNFLQDGGYVFTRAGDTPFRLENNSTGNKVPEPASLGLLGLGMAALAFGRRKKAA